ncbi:MAG TPA: response regulator [Methanocorpusculum sp.]|nr:response regulator [Methanocorpusculum sp.]
MAAEMKKTVLVVDDEEIARDIAVLALSEQYNVISAVSADDMQAKLKVCLPSIILLDLYLPDSTGLEILDILSSHKEWARIPVIFVTSEHDTEIECETLASGAFDYVRKPYSAEVLLTRVSRVLRDVKPTGALMRQRMVEQTKKDADRKLSVVEEYLREHVSEGIIYIKARDLAEKLEITPQMMSKCLAKIAEKDEFDVARWGNAGVWKIALKGDKEPGSDS